jgi:hypothetical protein
MLRKILPVITVNVLLVLLFIYFNYSIWTEVNGSNGILLIASHWGPIGISAPHYSYFNGVLNQSLGIYWYYNFPYWLFFVSTAVNLYFIAKLQEQNNKVKHHLDNTLVDS